MKTRESYEPLHLRRAPVYALEDAVKRLSELVGTAIDWTTLMAWLPEEWSGAPERRKSALASHFAATLELVKRGDADIRQDDLFGPILLRARKERRAAHV